MKITKKELRKLLKDGREEHPFGWKVWQLGAYIKNDNIYTFLAYHGQGLDINIYNCDYDKRVDLTDYINKNEYTLDLAVDNAYNQCKQMIDEYMSEKI